MTVLRLKLGRTVAIGHESGETNLVCIYDVGAGQDATAGRPDKRPIRPKLQRRLAFCRRRRSAPDQSIEHPGGVDEILYCYGLKQGEGELCARAAERQDVVVGARV